MGVTWYVGAGTVIIVVETVLIVWLLRHRAAGSRAQRLLKDRLRFETLLAELSAKLIHVEARGLDAALGGALQQAVSFLGMDRGNLDEYADGASLARISWTQPGMQPLPSILAVGHLSWTMDTLQHGGIVRFSRLRDLPAAASGDRASYERLGTRSHLSIPLRVGGPLLGVLSFDSVRAEREWPDELVERLWLLSEAFASALERKRMELSLADRLRFHRLLSYLSARFGNVAAVALDREIHNALRGIVDFAGVDRAILLEFPDGGRGRSWATDKPMDPERWPWLLTRVQGGDEVRMSRLEELPDEAAVDRRNAVALGLVSEAAVPLKAGGAVLGALVLATDSAAREWPDAFMEQLRLLCEVIANALAAAKAERESARLRQELAHIGRVSALGELTASLAHELSQPLTAILNNAEVAQHHLEAEVIQVAKLRDILDDIVADDKRAAGVIRRLRTMLKKGELEHVALNVNDVVREVTDLVRNDTVLRDIPVHLDLAVDLPPVHGDRAQLQQVVLNMVLNGLEATSASNGRAQGLVIRTSGVGGKEVIVAVEDSGPGIDVDDLDRLFQPLYTTKAEGLGMGLAIARTIVSAHGGQLRASNKAGGGAIFEFTLPAYAESATS